MPAVAIRRKNKVIAIAAAGDREEKARTEGTLSFQAKTAQKNSQKRQKT
jgi:hypothetical protein